jgi:hypothetical protein
MTSQQVSGTSSDRPPTFSSLVESALRNGGDSVSVVRPSIHMDEEFVSGYDAVVVGVGPPTSMSSNYLYPACIVGESARRVGNLVLMVDAPEPPKIVQSTMSILGGEGRLYKDLYGRRSGYRQVLGDEHLMGLVSSFLCHLRDDRWSRTVYPTLPWSVIGDLGLGGRVDEDNSSGLCLDSLITTPGSTAPRGTGVSGFAVSEHPRSPWVSSVSKTTGSPLLSVRESHREPFERTLERLSSARMTLVPTFRAGSVWWSPYLRLSLGVGTPVVTEWRRSSVLGASWSVLAQHIDEMDESSIATLVEGQSEAYTGAVPTVDGCTLAVREALS